MSDTDEVLARLKLRSTLTETSGATAAAGAGNWADTPSQFRAIDWTAAPEPTAARHANSTNWWLGRLRQRLAVHPKASVAAAVVLTALVLTVVATRGVTAGATLDESQALAVPSLSPIASPAGSGEVSAQPSLLVYVTGAVAQPGVLELPAAARLQDALDLAGGALATADLTVLNLAAPLSDGERVYVPVVGETPPPVIGPDWGSSGAGGDGTAGGRVNVNQATAEQLTSLPGIGPVLAARIVAFRATHGPFGSMAELDQVSGIGPKLLASLEDLVAF
jgi:competence protein ComEA